MSPLGNAVILVVEDDALIRLATRDRIEAAGFKVYEASNADDAIQLLEAHAGISLIFTDVDMPGSMDGVELAHFVRERWPPSLHLTGVTSRGVPFLELIQPAAVRRHGH
jgi:CheY-like chemotaxis protein